MKKEYAYITVYLDSSNPELMRANIVDILDSLKRGGAIISAVPDSKGVIHYIIKRPL
jgi:hypothetical protein